MMRSSPRLPLALVLVLGCGTSPGQAPPLETFRNLNQTFHIDLPKGWRQLAPNQARAIAALPGSPSQLHTAEPHLYYAVGPVDEWLAGNFSSAWLYVVEQDNEWLVEDDVAARLTEQWQKQGEATGTRYQLTDIHEEKVGAQEHPVLTATRTAEPPSPLPATTSLDVHAPTGGRQLTLSFTCLAAEYPRWQPEFRRWLATFTCARKPRGKPTLTDRLWTPLVTGAAIGLVLLLVYKHTRRR